MKLTFVSIWTLPPAIVPAVHNTCWIIPFVTLNFNIIVLMNTPISLYSRFCFAKDDRKYEYRYAQENLDISFFKKDNQENCLINTCNN